MTLSCIFGQLLLKVYIAVTDLTTTVQSVCLIGTHLYQWNVNIKPTISGSLLKWFLQNDKEEITADTKLITSRRLIPGTYKLEVTVSNAFGHLNTSMSFEAAVTVVALNFTFTNLFVNQTSILSVTINQYAPPTQIFIDFGDGTTYDSSLNQSFFIHEPLGNFSSTFIVRHLYSSTGVYAVYLNASNSISSFEHWTVAVVEIPISGIYLQLLSPSVVALLEEVVVKCSVEHGSNLRFEWDFGEDNDGQYTTVESFETVSVANHSYGIPDMYHVAVCVFNDYESVVVHLNTSIQAVEPIEQLHLRPRSGLHAAPLFEVKKEFSINGSIQYSTEPITFEAWVFRGSDVQFLFDFGDGTSELVPSENVWSVPCASVKHSYSAEGNYEVSVIATNLLDSMNETLDPAFYVQFLPEGLTLDKQYYIVPYSSNVSVHASVVQGTNVSFSWIVDNTRINNTDSAIVLPILQPGVYIVYVEAFNYVTDFGFKIINRPKVSAKIYVQQILQGVILCLELDGKECCDLQKIELPLDVPVKFKAKISPSTERALRFIWNVGLPDMKRTNAPFLEHRYLHAGWYEVNMTAQNHISSASSSSFQLHMIQKIANLTSIYCQGPNLVNHTITCHALYWFGTDLTFLWDFGDGSSHITTTSASVQHSYKDIGEYWVSVNVWNKFSHANITTNMFFLHYMCEKPEITFLHQKNRVVSFLSDVLVEAVVLTACKSINVEYTWVVKNELNIPVDFDLPDLLHQRQLIIPHNILEPGFYTIHLKVEMVGTIVYAAASTSLEIVLPNPVSFIEGGFVRWMGYNDTLEIVADINDVANLSQSLRYDWTCTPLTHKHLPCFRVREPSAFSSPDISRYYLPASLFTSELTAVVINVTVEGRMRVSASQVIELKNAPHVLLINIDCHHCRDHQVNQEDKIELKAVCTNCVNMNIEYTWKVWLIEDGKHEMHFSNYKCVQADGSTFFIIAPNSTVTAVDPRNNETYALNDDILENLDGSYHFSASGFISTGEMNDISSDDLPPFPDLLGFPEKITNSSMGLHVSESVHEIHHRSARGLPKTLNTDFLDPMLSQQMLSEGEAQYEDNLTLNSFPHPDFLPLQPPGLSLGSPDYLITEEGQPGESGSAAARDQSVQQIGAFLSEDEDHILEEAGKPRTKSSDTNSVLVNDPYGFGDPLRDNTLQQKPSTPHLVNRPKILLSLDNNSTTTGFVKQYLILKPGALKVGNTYLFQVNAKSNVGSLEGSAIHYFKVNVGPTNGRCTLMPIKGYSMNFYFGMHCLEWKSDHQPLYYELSYSFVEDDPGHLIYFGLNRNVKFVLPAGYPSNTYNVYLNVVVRDSIGAATKVCSLARMVEPLPIDSSLERYIYNETFHPGSELKKLLGAKRNQAVLHRIHVLSSSLNNVFNDWFPADPDRKILREKIRLKYFEVINNMKILNMVEAVQVLSVLSEIISDVQNVNVFALQKAYNIYLKIYALRSRLYGSYASSKLQYAIMVFLSKLGYATQSNSVRNHELNSISREYLIDEIKEIMMTRYKIEDPIEIIVPHIFIRALYLLKENRFFLPLKQTKIKIDGFILKSRKEKSRIKRCQSSDCLQSIEYPLLIAQEFDYITMYHNEMLLKDSRATIVSIALALLFDDQFEQPEHYLNFSVYFPRNHTHQCINKTLLMADQMNVHQVNITKSDLYHSLLFHVKLNSLKRGENRNNLDILFRYENMPTLQMYDMKISSSDDASELSMFIPQENIKAPGMYYFAILNQKYEEKNVPLEVTHEYDVFLWKELCMGKSSGFWSAQSCSALETSNYDWIHCRCSSVEVTAYSAPLHLYLEVIPISELTEPYFNPLPLAMFTFIMIIYYLLLLWNFQKDKIRNLASSPIPLRDNCQEHKQFYIICVETGMYFSSGTTASVFVVLHGINGMTETRQLIGTNSEMFSFQRGSVDTFLMSTEKNLGPLIKLEVWHNNHGKSPAWYLKVITVKDVETGISYCFDCYTWLSAERGDGQIERELTVNDTVPHFSKVFWETLITFIHDLNMWNSVIRESPASFFTGVQRITCCLSFLLNCAFILSVLQEKEFEELLKYCHLPHLSHETFLICFSVAAVATAPQMLLTFLFRFSRPPVMHLDPKFNALFFSFSFQNLYCWFQPKRSNSSNSVRSSSSVEDSDSLYSSFGESSVLSVPVGLEESFTTDEKDDLPVSESSDLSDPVSPLQKTITTWQAFENWLRRKHSLIIHSELVSGKHHSYMEKSDSEIIHNRIFLEEIDQELNTDTDDSPDLHFDASDPRHIAQDSNEINYDVSERSYFLGSRTDLSSECLYAPDAYFHPFFYYTAWLTVSCNIIISLTLTVIKGYRFTIPECLHWFKNIFITMVWSFSAVTPFVILLFCIISSLKIYLSKKKYFPPAAVVRSLKERNKYGIEIVETTCKRIEYFKKYLRPPKEQILQQFRKYAVKERIVCAMYSEIWKYISMLILLIALSRPEDTQSRYLQGTSIQKLLLKPKDISTWKSKEMLNQWLKYDFINHFYDGPDCLGQHMECGINILTGCITVGSIVIRNFKNSTVCNLYSQILNQCGVLKQADDANKTIESISNYERRLLNGYNNQYYIEDELLILKDEKSEAVVQLDSILQWLNGSFEAISLEFLLFNPSSSIFISISILFESSPLVPLVMNQNNLFVKMYSNFDHYVKFILYLIFLLITVVNFKNQLWNMLKHGSFYWKQYWNYFLLIFSIISVIFLIVYGIYIIHFIYALNKLSETHLSSNLNLINVALLEMINHDLLAFLVFLHLLGSLRVFSFSYRLRRLLKRLINVWKQIVVIFCAFLLLASLCSLMNRNFVGETHKHANPLLNIIKCINSIYKNCKKPEIISTGENVNRYLSTLNLFCIAAIHIGLLAIIRSILITVKCPNMMQKEKISLHESAKVIKRKLLACFDPGVPQVIAKDDYVLPIEFLLLELERLSEMLLIKANYLFSETEENNEPSTLNNVYFENIEDYFKSEEVLKLKNLCNVKSLDTDDLALQLPASVKSSCVPNLMTERLTATIPRQSKPKEKKFLPMSLNASLASQRKFNKNQNIESETSVQSHKIRKTYPLFQLESDSSSTETQTSSEKDLTNELPVRKTKSMGKGKIQEFHLNTLKES